MGRMNSLIVTCLVAAIAIAFCYEFLDRSYARWVHMHLHEYVLFQRVQFETSSLSPIAVAVIVMCGVCRFVGIP